ncbi:MAG: molybdenum cofactor guanylyltransferase [Actinomycetota bacterium]
MTGVVLAGGRSSRFGRDKLREPYKGAPLVHHAILALAGVSGDVLVVAPPGVRPDVPAGIPLLLMHDLAEGEGPLVALSNALSNVRTPLALVAAGDMPELAPAVLLELLRVAGEADVDAVALQDGDRFRPLPVVLRLRRARPIAAGLVRSGERRFRTLLDGLRVAVIDEPTWRALDPDGRTLFDVDEPSDLPPD